MLIEEAEREAELKARREADEDDELLLIAAALTEELQ